jgi:hypothetical protein
MKRFVIERNLPGAEKLSAEELREISQCWLEASNKLGNTDTWIESFIGEDKIYCVHLAESKEVVREHAKLAKFPINLISEIRAMIDPTTGSSFPLT